ncbi:MAG: histidine kinase [Cyclobacteriaceae bacterium]
MKIIIQNSLFQHTFLWLCSIGFFSLYFSISNHVQSIDIIYALIFHIPLWLVVYFNLKWLLIKYFVREKILFYFLGSTVLIMAAVAIHELLFDVLIPQLNSGYYIVSFTDRLVLCIIFSTYLILSTLLKLSSSWSKLRETEHEKTALELEAIKHRLNPHFLFNGLNSIYALSLQQNDHTPEAIHQLSELLRYALYKGEDDWATIGQETEIISHYLNLQSLRLENGELVVFQVDIQNKNIQLPPMLFFPLIENAFKYGNPNHTQSTINIEIKEDNSALHFNISNTIAKTDHTIANEGGIGLSSFAKRLKLVYGNQAKYQVQTENDQYIANVSIQL